MMPDAADDRATFANATKDGDQRMMRLMLALLHRAHLLSPITRFLPVIRWRGTLYALSYDAVQDILGDDEAFPAPFKQRMESLDQTGEVSILGFDKDEDYTRNLRQIMQSMPLESLEEVSRTVAAQASSIVSNAKGRLDAIDGLLTPVVFNIAKSYFGVKSTDPNALHCWTMAISNYTFGGDKQPEDLKNAAHAGGRLMDTELNEAIAALRPAGAICRSPDSLLERLAAMDSPKLDDNQMRATIAGLLSGFLPNVPAAGYNVLQVLLSRPAAMRIAHLAALANNDELLQRCIMEALRLRPLDPGRRRQCVNQAAPRVRARSWLGWRSAAIEKVYAVTLLAMCDGRHIHKPFTFDPDRPTADNMAFGFGKHFCVGAPIALCILTQALKPLLRQIGLRKLRDAPPVSLFIGFFPRSLCVRFDVAKP